MKILLLFLTLNHLAILSFNKKYLMNPTMKTGQKSGTSVGSEAIDRKYSELLETFMKTMKLECRQWLLQTLVSQNLCTRDIYFFILNQTNLRVEDQNLDVGTARAAMKSKILDVRRSLYKTYRIRRLMEKELLSLLNNKCYKLMRMVRKIRLQVKKEREKIIKNYEQKIETGQGW